ncbi:MAG: hypothetical protein ACK54C_02215 [Betaproteobacteria bacterium]
MGESGQHVVFTRKEERKFSAHHMLLRAARHALADAESERPGWLYDVLAAMTFSALTIEALCNSIGREVIHAWQRDSEACSPMTKVRILREQLGIPYDDTAAPWSDARALIRFRNDIAHAKPELIKNAETSSEPRVAPLGYKPLSKIEKGLAIGQARRAVTTAEAIKDALFDKLPVDETMSIVVDGWHQPTTAHFLPTEGPPA